MESVGIAAKKYLKAFTIGIAEQTNINEYKLIN